jgi:hypothetical protein
MKNYYYFIIFSCLCLSFSCTEKSYDSEIKEIAEGTNKNLPTMIDSGSRLDSVNIEKGRTFQYNVTLISVDKSEIKRGNNVTFANNQKALILERLENLKKEFNFKFFIENDVTFSYSYYDKNGEFILKLLVPPNEYK